MSPLQLDLVATLKERLYDQLRQLPGLIHMHERALGLAYARRADELHQEAEELFDLRDWAAGSVALAEAVDLFTLTWLRRSDAMPTGLRSWCRDTLVEVRP